MDNLEEILTAALEKLKVPPSTVNVSSQLATETTSSVCAAAMVSMATFLPFNMH